MNTLSKRILISADTIEEIDQVASLVQDTIDSVENTDLIKLLTAVKNKPSLAKTALNFIK